MNMGLDGQHIQYGFLRREILPIPAGIQTP
jgi:hypothetical protein